MDHDSNGELVDMYGIPLVDLEVKGDYTPHSAPQLSQEWNYIDKK
jgi:hypothetical protein